MGPFLRTLAITVLCGAMVIPVAEAQDRRGNRNGSRTEQTHAGRRHQENRSDRNRQTKHNKNKGHNIGGGHAYDKKAHSYKHRSDRHNPQHPGYGHHNKAHKPHVMPPAGHYGPKRHAYRRPVTPPSFRPHHRCPVIKTILGISVGTAFNVSLNHLINNGFIVDGYGNDVVYLRNVRQMSMIWPDATLYYGPGGLIGSEFSCSANYCDMTRYNQLYATFVTQYGAPVSVYQTGNRYGATWFGHDGYVSLKFEQDYSRGGDMRYYTYLSFGL